MKPREVVSSHSCSCTSCFYKSESDNASMSRFVARGSKVDKLFKSKYLPQREEKLLKKLIKTREVYDDIRTTLLSDHNDSDVAYLKPKRRMPMRTLNENRDWKGYDDNERNSALLELVNLIDRGAGLPHRLSECCSCCVCGGSTIDRRNQRIRKHKHGPLSSLSSMTSGIKGRDQRRGSRHAYRAKNIQSDPCTCTTTKTCNDEECDMKLSMKNTPKPLIEQYEGTTLEQKADRHQNVKGYKNRLSGMGESLRRFKISKESIIMDTKNKLRDQYRRRTKRYLYTEHRYSLRHNKKSKEEEEKEINDAIKELKRESLIRLKEIKRKIKKEKMLKNIDKDTLRYQMPEPHEGETQYTGKNEEIQHTEERTPKVTAIQTKKDKDDSKRKSTKQKTKKLNKPIIQSKPFESEKSLITPENKTPLKTDKLEIEHPKDLAKKNFGSGGYALKRCFCTLKLKPKSNKTRRKSHSRSLQTETSKSQSSTTTTHIVPHGINYISTPSNTRKLKQSTKLTSNNVALSNLKQSLLPYECEPGVCVPDECDPIECDKLIRKRESSYDSNTQSKRHTQSICQCSSLEKLTIESSQTSFPTSDKTMNTNEENEKEKKLQKKDIPVSTRAEPMAMSTKRKGRAQKHTPKRPPQISRGTRSRYSLQKHKLKRCFCTLKFTKRGKTPAVTHSKRTLTSSMTMSDIKEKTILRDSSTMIKENRDKKRYRLQKYECEPGICVPNECDPYQCLELMKNRHKTQHSRDSRPFKTKSSYSIARKRLPKSRRIQSVSSLQERSNVFRGKTANVPNQIVSSPERVVSGPKQLASNPTPDNRPAVKIGSAFSLSVKFYKEKGGAKPISKPKPVKMTLGKGINKSLQRRTKSHHKSTSGQMYTQNEGRMKTSLSTKRCFCTLKLQKRAKHPATNSSTATETEMTKEIYPKVDMVTRNTKMKRKNIRKILPNECEPNVCVPEECDPVVCLKRIQLRDKVRSKNVGSSTDNYYNKTTSSITSSLISKSKNVLVKSDSGRSRKKRKRSKYTTSSSRSKEFVSPNISSSRQAVRIGSNFSFNVEFYKNRSLDMSEEPVTVGSKKKILDGNKGHGSYKTSANNNPNKTQSATNKANNASWIQPIMKLMNIQKKTKYPSMKPKPFTPLVMTAQIHNDQLQKIYKNQSKYISTKRSVKSRKSVWYRSNLLTASINAISNIWFNSKKSIVSSDMAYNMEKTCRISHGVINKDDIQNRKITRQSPFVQRSVCTMNVQYLSARKAHKLEPYECEPGVCIPGECDPYECQKLIMKRLTKRSSTMTGRGDKSKLTSMGGTQIKASEKHRSRKRKGTQERAPVAISYKLPPAKSRKKAVRIGSTFSFDVEFFKNRKSASPKKIYFDRKPVSKRNGHSVGSSPHDGKYHDRGLGSSQVPQETRPSQYGFMTRDVGSSIVRPKSKRCFCTLKLMKKGKMQLQAGHEAKPQKPPYVDAAQNTKKYNIPYLDPNECEPGVCVPGECDPYECLERIKRRNYGSKDFGTGMQSHSVSCSSTVCEKLKCPLKKCVKTGEKKQKISKPKELRDRSASFILDSPTTASVVRKASPASHRQAVKIGSTFSFNVEFYKGKTAQQTSEDVKPALRYNSKPKERKKYNQGNITTSSSISKSVQDYPGLHHQDSQASGAETRAAGSGTDAFLKRCFCTAKFFQNHTTAEDKLLKKHAEPSFVQRCWCKLKTLGARSSPKAPPIYADASNQTLKYKEQRMPKLEPYECEPGVCVPGECDPFECLKRIKLRNKAAQMTGTGFGDTRSTSTTFRQSRPTKSVRSYARERKPKQPQEPSEEIVFEQPQPTKLQAPSNRNVVKIGSSFSFNIEFYRTNYAGGKPKKRRIHSSSTSSQISHRKLKGRGVNKRTRFHDRSSQGASLGRGEQGTGMLKRCFCTLALQADGKEMMTQGTDSPYYKTYPTYDDKNTLTNKLLPYECEPGVCFPGECDPYECLKRILRRREYGTSTKRLGTSSVSTLMKQRETPPKARDNYAQSRLERPERPIRISKAPRHRRQAVKIGSVFSFNVEFSKSKTDGQEYVQEMNPDTVVVRKPRISKYKTSSTTGQPLNRMSTMSTSQEKYQRDTDSQASKNLQRDVALQRDSKPFLKRCFCTLQFKNIEKNGRRAPVNVYTATVNTQCKAFLNQNTKTRTPVKKQRTTRLSNHQNTSRVKLNYDSEVEFLKKHVNENPYNTRTPHVYPTILKTTCPFSCRAAQPNKGGIFAGWNVEPRIRRCRVKVNKSVRLKKSECQKLGPYECEPNVCIPGECDPYECLARIQKRYQRDMGVGGVSRNMKSATKDTNSFIGDKISYKNVNVKPKETCPRRNKARNNVQRKQRRMSYTRDAQDHHCSRVGSSFSCNIEFYKNCSPSGYQKDNSKSDYDTRPRVKTCSRRNTVTNTKTTDRHIAANACDVSDKCIQAKCAQRDISSGMKPLLRRCFCTLKLIMKNKTDIQHDITKPQTVDKNVDANFQPRVLGMLLDPNECEPGVCIPGQCDPYECLERIQKRNRINHGTDPVHSNKVCRQTSCQPESCPPCGLDLRSTKKPIRDTAIVEIPRIPFIHPEYRQGVRYGSNIKCSVEFFKDYCVCPDAKANTPITDKMARDSKIYRPMYAQGYNQTKKPISRCNKTKCPYGMDSTIQTKMRTEDKSSIVGKALKRCFCTAKLQNRGLKPCNNLIVGRIDKLITNSPFQPNNFQIFRMQKRRQCPNDDVETILPYEAKTFKNIKSKTSINRKGILKKDHCMCCETMCNDRCNELVCALAAKEKKMNIKKANKRKTKNIKCSQVQEESQNDPETKPLCKDCTKKKQKKTSKNKKAKMSCECEQKADNVIKPCQNCKKHPTKCNCKCKFCKCKFCKYNVKHKAKSIKCRFCKKLLKKEDYGRICAHCGVVFESEENDIQPTAKLSMGHTKKKSKLVNFDNPDAAIGEGDIKSPSKNKTNASKKSIRQGNGDVACPSKHVTDASKGILNISDIKCASSCLGIKKKKIKIQEKSYCSEECKGRKDKGKKKDKKSSVAAECLCPAPPPPPTCAETCLKPKIGLNLSKVGTYEMPLLGKVKPPCICGSKVCATQSFKDRLPKDEPKPPEECLCGSSVCQEENKRMRELKQQKIEQETAQKKKKQELKEHAQKIKGEQKKKLKDKSKTHKKKAKDNKAQLKKKQQLQSQKQKLAKQKKRKELKQKQKKKKKQAILLKKKKKKQLKDMMKRRKIYDKEDEKRRRYRKLMDKKMYKLVKKTKTHGDCALLTGSIVDISKLGCVTLADILRSTCRAVTDPRNTAYSAKTMYKEPSLAVKKAKEAVVHSGIGSTYKRVRLRVGYMERYKLLREKIDSNRITHTLFHMFDRRPPKFRPRRKLKKKEPIDFDCSPYMASLRKHPYLSVWYNCPWFYPHCMSLLNLWRQFTDVVLFFLAVLVWCPCIFLWEAFRALVCCTMCTA